MTAISLPPNSPEKLAETGQAQFINGGETVDFHKSDLPAFTPGEYLRIAQQLAHSANEFNKAEPNDIDTNRIEQLQAARTIKRFQDVGHALAEKAVNVPFNPVEYPKAVGSNLYILRANAMGEERIGEPALPKAASLGDQTSYDLTA